ncbi:MAG: PAS domain S-box protein [Elainellaceae cyanobacterium]
MMTSLDQIIQPCPTVVSPQTLAEQVISLMSQHDLSYAIIADAGQIKGIFTERDLVRVVATKKFSLELPISDLMVSTVITFNIERDQPNIEDILQRMGQYQIQQLPVVDAHNQLLGVMTHANLVRSLDFDKHPAQIKELHHKDPGNTDSDNKDPDNPDGAQALQESEGCLRSILDSSSYSIFLKDLQGRYIYANSAYQCMTQLRQDQLISKTDFDILSNEAALGCQASDNAALTAGHPLVFEEQVPLAEGLGTLLMTKFPLLDYNGRPLAVCGIALDITGRRRAEETLRRREQEFRALVENSPDVISRVDRNYRFVYVNPRIEETTGIPSAHWIGKTELEMGFPETLVNPWHTALQHVFDTGEELVYESDFPSPDGIKIWLVRMVPEWSEDGSVQTILNIGRDITDRKYAELERIRSHDLQEAIFNKSADALFVVDPETLLIIDCNDRAVELFEANDKSTLMSIKGYMLQKRPFTNQETEESRRAVDHQHFWSQEVEYITLKGNEFWGNLAATQICVADQAFHLVRVTDISDRKRSEEALRKYERIIAASTDGVALVDTNYVYQVANQAHLDWHRLERSDVLGHTVADLIGDDVFESVIREPLDQCLAGQTVQYENWFPYPNTGHHFMNVTYYPYIDEAGEITGAVVSIRNLTALKEAEIALRESEERFRRVFEDAAVGMAIAQIDGQLIQVNQALCDIVGYSEADLLTKVVQDFTHPDDLEPELEYLQQLLTNTISYYRIEKRYIHKQGHIVWVLLSVSLVRDAHGSPSHVIGIVQDISDRKEIDRMKDEFISIVSHELRTPLTAIQGSLGILATGIYDKNPIKAKRMLEIAALDTERLARLVNDILDLERLESGKVELVMQSCQVADLLQQSVEAMQSIAEDADVSLVCQPVQVMVRAAPDAIIQTLTNLIGNAIKFSPSHSAVTVSATPAASFIRFQITDQGRGIPPEKLDSIFKRFEQVDVSDSRQKGGTGLGLTICQTIVEQHGGKIWVDSVPNQGSTFYFTIPRDND